jgi:hypothetical protein
MKRIINREGFPDQNTRKGGLTMWVKLIVDDGEDKIKRRYYIKTDSVVQAILNHQEAYPKDKNINYQILKERPKWTKLK